MKTAGAILLSFSLLAAVVWFAPQWLGVWPPDVASPRVHVLATAASSAGDRFQVVQYWNRGDFYTTELEHLAPDGSFTVQQIDWDDDKRWASEIRVSDQDGKAYVTFPRRSTIWEYDWHLKAFVAPFDSREVPLVLRTWERPSLAKGGEAVTRTRSWVTEAGQRQAAEDDKLESQ